VERGGAEEAFVNGSCLVGFSWKHFKKDFEKGRTGVLRKLLRRLHQEEHGFTLVELIVVIVILGVLAGLGIQQFGNIQETARKNANKANVRMLLSAARLYLMMEPPESIKEDTFTPSQPGALDSYIADWPEDPWGSDEYEVRIRAGEDGAWEVVIYLAGEKQYPADESGDQ
jgi:prepilin-type N-terminal cleavage/methylation domain-containing protein